MNTQYGILTRDDLFNLEQLRRDPQDFRARVMAHKKHRQVHLGNMATLYFEDRLTMQYQIQEMLRVERIFESAGIQEELDAYNPLIPDGSNWKATFMIEVPDEDERARCWPGSSASRTRYGCGSRASSRSSPSPTRTWSATRRRRPPRCISCVSS
jgi:hypothetical protein